MFRSSRLAGIRYLGKHGISQECMLAIEQLIQFREFIPMGYLLTYKSQHAFLFLTADGFDIAIKQGFTSGYAGEGPRALARCLHLLQRYGTHIDEVEVSKQVFDRLENSALTQNDLFEIRSKVPRHQLGLFDYIHEAYSGSPKPEELWPKFRHLLPLSIADTRLEDLFSDFFHNPEDCLLRGYKRLEDIVRLRTGLKEHGAKLFTRAFLGDQSPLTWQPGDTGEITGKANLFSSAYMAHRNPLAHREDSRNIDSMISEFLLLNHLYKLELEAIER